MIIKDPTIYLREKWRDFMTAPEFAAEIKADDEETQRASESYRRMILEGAE